MRLALVKSPKLGSQSRGVGFYTDRLFSSLKEQKNVEPFLVDFSFNPFSYAGYDLIHYPFFEPFFLTLPPIRIKKTIVTIHDLTPIVLKDGFPRGIKGEAKWQVQKHICQSVNKIVTDSIASKKDITRLLSLNENAVSVIYAAPGNEFKKISDKDILSKIVSKYGIKSKFLLYAGDVNFNKNILGLLRAFSEIRKEIPELRLFLVGKSFLDNNLIEVQNINKEIMALDLKNNINMPGFVPTEDLVGLYNLAACYVQPSIYEGFGFPVVEAMACGCPVVCGRNSSLPELAGEAAFYVDVTNPKEFANGIKLAVLLTNDKRLKLENILIKQSQKLTWDKTAREMAKLYETVLEGD